MIVLRQHAVADIRFPLSPIEKPMIMCPIKQECQAQRRRVQPPRQLELERLPQLVQREILSYLDYQSLIMLSCTNRYFHSVVKPVEMADDMDKFSFIMNAAKDFQQHRPSEKGSEHKPGNLECYICFRVRGPDHFDIRPRESMYFDLQGRPVVDREPGPNDRLLSLRRFCVECGVKISGSADVRKFGRNPAACDAPTAGPTVPSGLDKGCVKHWLGTGTDELQRTILDYH